MRIGIDARFFGPQETGIGRYVDRLVFHLGQQDQTNDYMVFLRRAAWEQWQPPNERWHKVLADYHWYSVREQLLLPVIFNRAKLDLLHVPHFNVPVLYRRPFVVTIHDLILNQFPTERASTLGPLLFRAKFIVYQFIVRQAITRSAAIITVSENSKRELTERYHQSPTKITVTYESVDPLSPAVPIDVLRPRGIHRPYILYVGNAYPHKNLERLLDASKIARQQGEEFQVVLVGKRDYFSRRLEAYAKEQGMNHVIFFGFASDAELSALYTQAIAYFFPSLSEGFGLPGLEAMQAGVPVWASNASCLPEVFGPAARYFDPHDTASIAASIETALHDTLRSAMITAGFDRLQRFSWAAMAKQTLTVYQEVYARSQKKKSHP